MVGWFHETFGKDSKLEIFHFFCSDGLKFEINHHHHHHRHHHHHHHHHHRHHPDPFFSPHLRIDWFVSNKKSPSVSPARSRSAISQPNLMVKKAANFSQFIWLAFCTILQVERLPFPFCQDTKLTFWSTHCDRWERDGGHPLQEKHGIGL